MKENTPQASQSLPYEVLPWWAYFAGGALAGWLARGRLIWIAGGLAALWVLRETAATRARASQAAPPPHPEKKAVGLSAVGTAGAEPAPVPPVEGVDSWLPSDFDALANGADFDTLANGKGITHA